MFYYVTQYVIISRSLVIIIQCSLNRICFNSLLILWLKQFAQCLHQFKNSIIRGKNHHFYLSIIFLTLLQLSHKRFEDATFGYVYFKMLQAVSDSRAKPFRGNVPLLWFIFNHVVNRNLIRQAFCATLSRIYNFLGVKGFAAVSNCGGNKNDTLHLLSL